MAQQKRKAMLKENPISDVPARRADGNAQGAASGWSAFYRRCFHAVACDRKQTEARRFAALH